MWRSLLFVPPLDERLVAGAATRGADVVVLDLEAAVAVDRKDQARASLTDLIPCLQRQGATVAVRINTPVLGEEQDIRSACLAGAEMLVIPKATVATMVRVSQSVSAFKDSQKFPGKAQTVVVDDESSQPGDSHTNVKLVPLIEDPRGVLDALAIASAAPGIVALGFGVEDYATEMGADPSPELLRPAGFQVIQAARAAGCEPLVFLDTIANYKDMQRFEAASRMSRSLGASGSFSIHPAQVGVLNAIFTPDEAQVKAAQCIVNAAEQARMVGQAIVTLDGRMIDEPVERRARKVLRLAASLC